MRAHGPAPALGLPRHVRAGGGPARRGRRGPHRRRGRDDRPRPRRPQPARHRAAAARRRAAAAAPADPRVRRGAARCRGVRARSAPVTPTCSARWPRRSPRTCSAGVRAPRSSAWTPSTTTSARRLQWLIDRGDAEEALGLIGKLWWLWFSHGHFEEGGTFIRAALALDGARQPAARPRLPGRLAPRVVARRLRLDRDLQPRAGGVRPRGRGRVGPRLGADGAMPPSRCSPLQSARLRCSARAAGGSPRSGATGRPLRASHHRRRALVRRGRGRGGRGVRRGGGDLRAARARLGARFGAARRGPDGRARRTCRARRRALPRRPAPQRRHRRPRGQRPGAQLPRGHQPRRARHRDRRGPLRRRPRPRA